MKINRPLTMQGDPLLTQIMVKKDADEQEYQAVSLVVGEGIDATQQDKKTVFISAKPLKTEIENIQKTLQGLDDTLENLVKSVEEI